MPVERGDDATQGDIVPVLSVVIACLNGADTLGTQLEALASQPCPVPWELLLCDNGSTDGTVQLAERYRPRLPGLRIIDASAVRGAGPARNYGVQRARGTWVAFCDADDEVASDWLATMVAALRDHRFVAGRFEKYRLNGARVLRSRPLQQQDELQTSDIGARLPHAGGGNMGMYRADFLAIGGFDPQIRWLEDTDLSWRAQLAGIRLTFHPEVVVHVRLRQTFRTMYAQGRQYGVAHALLEERYGRPDAPAQPPAAPPAGQPSSVPPGTGPFPVPVEAAAAAGERAAGSGGPGAFLTFLIDHIVAGRLIWRFGWVAGHRSHRVGLLGPAPRPLESLSRPAAAEPPARDVRGRARLPRDPDATRPLPTKPSLRS